jgi:hypothetical protein
LFGSSGGSAAKHSVLHPVQGQVVGGTISCTISDKSGPVVANATVSMKNLATEVTTVVKSNTQGLYSLPNLLPGNYQQTVSAAGFETAINRGGKRNCL